MPSPLEMDKQELDDYLDEQRRIEATHSWVYGTWDVVCAICHQSKAQATKACGVGDPRPPYARTAPFVPGLADKFHRGEL